MSTATIFAEALNLAEEDRLRLIELLNDSLAGAATDSIEDAQVVEARKRLDAHARGEIGTVDGARLMDELMARYR